MTTAPGRPSSAARPTTPPPSRPTPPCGWPGIRSTPRTCGRPGSIVLDHGGLERVARLHEDLALAVRALVVGARARDAAGVDLPAGLGAAQPLRLRLLGQAAGRRADGRLGVPAGARDPDHARRAPSAAGPPQSRTASPIPSPGVHRARPRPARVRAPPVRALRKRALRRMERWILEHQEADGCWGGIQPPWVYSIMALTLRGYPLDHPVVRKAIDGLDGFTIVDDQGRRLRGLPVTGLGHVPGADRALRRRAAGGHPALARRRAGWSPRRSPSTATGP